MKTKQRIVRLGEIARFKYGTIPNPERILAEDAEGGYPIFTGYRIAGRYPVANLTQPHLIVVCRGVGGTGDVKISPPACWLTNLSIYFDFTDKEVDLVYLNYFFQVYNLRFLDTGSAQSQITIADLSRLKIPLPPVSTQRKIASILSAYDDLIENNKRRIAILEKMAEEIYREWFVRMRFSSYAKATEDKPFQVMRFGDVYEIQYGSNLPTEKIQSIGRFPVYGAGGILGFYSEYNVQSKVSLITCRGNGSGTIWRTSHDNTFVTNNSFKVRNRTLGDDEFYFSYFHLQFCSVERALSGSAQPQITIDGLSKIHVAVPSPSAAKRFIDVSKPIMEMIDKLTESNHILAKTRDILLPRLISGKLSVENLELPSNESASTISSALPQAELAHA